MIKSIFYTLSISLTSVIIGFIIGTIIELLRYINFKILTFILNSYKCLIRNIPQLVLLFIVYFGIPSVLKINLGTVTSSVIACSISCSAYLAEVIRGGIQSVDKGQYEAGYSLGLSKYQVFRYIAYPQALKIIIPSLLNELVSTVKSTSIFSVIGVNEITRYGQNEISRTYKTFEIWSYIAFIYFVINFLLTKFSNYIERRLK